MSEDNDEIDEILQIKVDIKGDVKRKWLELEEYYRKRYGVETRAGLVRHLISEVYYDIFGEEIV